MPYADQAQEYDSMAWRRQITAVKVYQGVERTIAGVQCTIYQDASDAGRADKLTGIQDGLKRVVDAGFDFPDGITFYTSSVAGFQSVAYHRDLGGAGTTRNAVVLLGAGAVNTGGMVGRQGVADKIANQSAAAYCAAVVVHELGHNLHERLAGDFFWTADANSMPDVAVAMKVSQYATTNKKEVVAEVFTGMLYGITYDAAVHALYDGYGGMYSPALAGGGRRRK